MNICGLPECGSRCHVPGVQGAYCAPTRCYCGGCPAALPAVERGRPVTLAESEASRAQLVAETRQRLAAATVAHAVEDGRVLAATGGLVTA